MKERARVVCPLKKLTINFIISKKNFWLNRAACRILAPRLRVRTHDPLRWKAESSPLDRRGSPCHVFKETFKTQTRKTE